MKNHPKAELLYRFFFYWKESSCQICKARVRWYGKIDFPPKCNVTLLNGTYAVKSVKKSHEMQISINPDCLKVVFQQLLPLVNFKGYRLVLSIFWKANFCWDYKLDFVVACGDILEITLVTFNWMKSEAAPHPITPSSGLLRLVTLSVTLWIGLLLRVDYSLDYFRLSLWLSIWLFTSPSSIKWESFAEYQKHQTQFCKKVKNWFLNKKEQIYFLFRTI